MLKKIGPIIDELMSDIDRARETTSTPPRTLHRIQSPPSAALSAAYATIGELLALCDQGLLQPPVTLTANGHRHVGETLAQARAVVGRSRGDATEGGGA